MAGIGTSDAAGLESSYLQSWAELGKGRYGMVCEMMAKTRKKCCSCGLLTAYCCSRRISFPTQPVPCRFLVKAKEHVVNEDHSGT